MKNKTELTLQAASFWFTAKKTPSHAAPGRNIISHTLILLSKPCQLFRLKIPQSLAIKARPKKRKKEKRLHPGVDAIVHLFSGTHSKISGS